jgi:lipopolysaccharide transport system permease protein
MSTDIEPVVAAHPSQPESAARPATPLMVIEPPKGWISLNLGEVWRYRGLLWQLVWRNVSANYRQSVVGIGWALLKPALSVLIFTVIFGRVAGLPTDGTPYPIFSYSALLPWMYFSTVLTLSSGSIVVGSGLLTKVYFPRLILPLTGVLNGLVDFAIQLSLLAVLMLWYGVTPGWGIVLLPILVLQCAIAALAVGLWLCALNVKYRDVGHLVPFLSQAWMWITPIVYSSSMVPEKWRTVYGLNPMVGVVEGFRWAICGKSVPDWTMMGISTAVVGALLLSGLYYFRRVETTFADII